MMQKSIEHRRHFRGVSEELSPILNGSVGSDEGASPLVASHDQLEQVIRRRRRKLSHPQIIDDQQLCLSQMLDEDFAVAPDGPVLQILQQLVSFSIDDEKTMLANSGPADRLRDVTLAGAGRPQEESAPCSRRALAPTGIPQDKRLSAETDPPTAEPSMASTTSITGRLQRDAVLGSGPLARSPLE